MVIEDNPVENVAQVSWIIGESADWLMLLVSGAYALTDLSSWLELNQELMLSVSVWIAQKASGEIVFGAWGSRKETSVLGNF